MRFTQRFDVFRMLKNSAFRLLRTIQLPFYNLYRWIYRKLNPQTFTNQVITDVRKGSKNLFSKKIDSLKDYIAFPRYYVAKKLLFIILIAALLLPILFFKYLQPMVISHFFTKTMIINSAEMSGYTGKVKLLRTDGKTVLYRGDMDAGRITGTGKLYDADGNVVYIGDFEKEQYAGEGELYLPDGTLTYRGTFANNVYEGMGTLYDANGMLQYTGAFVNGLYEGAGSQYYDNGQLQYEGTFVKGRPDGSGTLYSAEGEPVYEGDLKAGQFEGSGIVYENGAPLYEGALAHNKMEGSGKIYSGDTVIYDGEFRDNTYEGTGKSYDPLTGTLLYDGSFSKGQYSGEGQRFDAATGNPTYQGGFYNGYREGQGSAYDPATNTLLYTGGFHLDRYEGKGIQYDAASGMKLYEGDFKSGFYHGEGTLYDPITGAVAAQGIFMNGAFIRDTREETLPALVYDTAHDRWLDPTTGEAVNPATREPIPADTQVPTDAAGQGDVAPSETPQTPTDANDTNDANHANDTNASDTAQNPSDNPASDTPQTPASDTNVDTGIGGEGTYAGPMTENGTAVDYLALAALSTEKAAQAFANLSGSEWELEDGNAVVYEDAAADLGVTMQTDTQGNFVGIDVWNTAPVSGVKVGMTMDEMTAVLGDPTAGIQTEPMGETRMVSVSQANRAAGRLTNLSADSLVNVVTYSVNGQMLRAIFVKGEEGALLLELRQLPQTTSDAKES